MNKEEQSLVYASSYNESVFDLISSNKKILEVGCNTGNLGEKLVKEKDCEVWGIDYSKSVIEIAKKRITKAVIFDLETYEIPFPEEKFDIIVFADVLEHVRYPELILEKFMSMLNNNGVIIASIPNIANINVRFKLLFGNWDYRKDGLLDSTHLRFFTKKTIFELFDVSGYNIIQINSTPGFNFIFLRHFDLLKRMAKYLCKINTKLFALQFIVIAQKK